MGAVVVVPAAATHPSDFENRRPLAADNVTIMCFLGTIFSLKQADDFQRRSRVHVTLIFSSRRIFDRGSRLFGADSNGSGFYCFLLSFIAFFFASSGVKRLLLRSQLKALVWFWIIDETLVLTSILSVCRLNEVGTCQVMEQVMIMVSMVMTTR